MTTTVTVKACVPENMHVKVTLSNTEPSTFLQHGEQQDFHIWDDITISVVEEVKSPVESAQASVNIGGDGPSL